MIDDINRIHDALQFIPADDRDDWIAIGMAIKSELGDDGQPIWDTWSQSADNYNPADSKTVWRGISPSGATGIGTLFHMAKQNGWHGSGEKPDPAEIEKRKREAQRRAAEEAAKAGATRKAAAGKAVELWKAAQPASADNPYLKRKHAAPVDTLREIDAHQAAQILEYTPKSSGELLTGRLLVVPIKVDGQLSTVELIDGNGHKAALAGGAKSGGYWAAQPLPEIVDTLLIGEGVATVMSAKEATDYPTVAALSCGNLAKVAQTMRERYPSAKLVILADIGNGRPKAEEAARTVNGLLAVPEFGDNAPEGMTDFNDMATSLGLDAVKAWIERAESPVKEPVHTDSDWPKPESITAKIAPQPYPLDALPNTIRAAVQEVVGFVKAPVPMVASSALAALSLAGQAHVDVKRAEKLQGPVSLSFLTIADSGERKSTCDGFFQAPIRQYQDHQAKEMKPEVERHKAELDAWRAERDGLLLAIKDASKKGKNSDGLRTDLAELQHQKPEAPKVPRMLLSDETPENLAWSLKHNWPSAAVASSEAGAVFGAHGMGRDSVMRNLALLNILWDGGTHSVGRKTSESFTVKGARLTVALQVQEPTLRDFFAKTGDLAGGTGFLARCLVAWPESTQGFRPFTEAPENWPHLAAFHRRITEILDAEVVIDDDGALSPALMPLTTDAKSAWIEYHNAIENGLASGGELHEVRDVASKTADNAVRLAALFQLFDDPSKDAVSLSAFEGAARIAAWHLSEAQRFFGELALPSELADAARLDSWLIEYCKREKTTVVGKNHTRRHGPLRDGKRLDTAISELANLDRLRLVKADRRLMIYLNPALTEAV